MHAAPRRSLRFAALSAIACCLAWAAGGLHTAAPVTSDSPAAAAVADGTATSTAASGSALSRGDRIPRSPADLRTADSVQLVLSRLKRPSGEKRLPVGGGISAPALVTVGAGWAFDASPTRRGGSSACGSLVTQQVRLQI